MVGDVIRYANRDEAINDIFLPQCLEYYLYYSRYMDGIEYDVKIHDTGNYNVEHRGEGYKIPFVSLTITTCVIMEISR